MLPRLSVSTDGRRKYKHIIKRFHDIKHDVNKGKKSSIIIPLLLCIICFVILTIYFIYPNINILSSIYTITTREPLIISNSKHNNTILINEVINPNSTNTKNESSINNNNNDINLMSNLSFPQINIELFIQNWGKKAAESPSSAPTSSDSNSNSSSLINIWVNNSLSASPPSSLSSSILSSINISSVIWDFGACGCTGWGIETVNIIKYLSLRIDNIKLITDYDCWCPGFKQSTIDLMNDLQSRNDYTEWEPHQIFISHKPPSRYPIFPYYGIISLYNRPNILIGRSMTEVDYLSDDDIISIESIDELWVPSRFVKIIYMRNGISPNKIRIIPLPLNIDIYNDNVKPFKKLPSKNIKKGLIKINRRTFKFLSVFKWEPRKGYDVLINAFINEFNMDDNVQLYLQTYAYSMSDDLSRKHSNLEMKLNETIAAIIDASDSLNSSYIMKYIYPKIEIMTKKRTMTQLASLYKTVNCYIQSSHGEGFGLPVLEAMGVGTPVIVTKWSGLRDIVINQSYGYLIDIDGKEFAKNEFGKHDFIENKQKWAKINVKSLMKHMRFVYKNRKIAKKIGKNGQKYVQKHFHPTVITNKIETRMKELIFEYNLKHTQFAQNN